MSCYYAIVKSEVIYVYEGFCLRMWDRISVPFAVRMRKAEGMRSHEFEAKRY